MSSCFCLLPVPELNGAVKPCFRAVFAAAPPQLLFCHVCRAEGTPPPVGQEAWTLEVNRVLMSAVIFVEMITVFVPQQKLRCTRCLVQLEPAGLFPPLIGRLEGM